MKFSGVHLKPRGGWTPERDAPGVPEGEMAESLDYSGLVLRVGLAVEFGMWGLAATAPRDRGR